MSRPIERGQLEKELQRLTKEFEANKGLVQDYYKKEIIKLQSRIKGLR